MIKAVVFDFDGLLINSEPVWFKAREALFLEYETEWTWEDQKNNMGVSTKTWTKYMEKKLNYRLPPEKITGIIVDKMKQIYTGGDIELKPGAAEAITYCRQKYKTGLASGSHKALLYAALESLNWKNYFDEILSSDDLEKGKPSPLIYIEICKRLQVRPEETVVLEDSKDGMIAGISAGTNVIGIPSNELPVPDDVLSKTKTVLNSLSEFEDYLKKL
ncbi:MAG: HAD family phosphatase [Ignavibacteria bacterium]|jgi:sugar-phosphatase